MDPTTKIVIFEDEYLLANDLKRQLSHFGYEVTAMFRKAEDGIKFLSSVKDSSQFPEVVLMDITLAGRLTGIDAAVVIAENYPCALVFITGMSQFEYFEEAFRTKPFAFLLKPFEVSQAVVSIKLAIYQKELELKLLKYQKELEEKVAERNNEIKIARKTAEEATMAKQEFLDQVSGQILDPIYGIMGLSAMIKEEIKDKPGLMRYTEYLEDNSRHLFSLLNSILDLRKDDTH
jgi:DNA-binding NtrC family response regulator